MKELVCIVCPNGCRLSIGSDGSVQNAGCPRGVCFAEEEMTCPKRTVCSTVATVFPDFPVLPVRTSQEIPKQKIPELMRLLGGICIDRRLERGEVILSRVCGTSADLISTSSMCYQYYRKAGKRE